MAVKLPLQSAEKETIEIVLVLCRSEEKWRGIASSGQGETIGHVFS
jgi:hypothetical protein